MSTIFRPATDAEILAVKNLSRDQRDSLFAEINSANPQSVFQPAGESKSADKAKIICPKCGNGTGDSATPIEADFKDGVWLYHCFKSRDLEGRLIDVITKEENLSLTNFDQLCEALAIGAAAAGIAVESLADQNYSSQRPATKPARQSTDIRDTPEFKKLVQSDLAEALNHVDDWPKDQRRGLTDKTIRHFQFGFAQRWIHPNLRIEGKQGTPTRRIIAPTESGRHYNAIALPEDRKSNPKYLHEKPKLHAGYMELFNSAALATNDDLVVVVEGEFDCASLWQAFEGNISVVAVLGCSNWKKTLLPKLDGLTNKKFLILFDAEQDTRKAARELRDELIKRNFPATCRFFYDALTSRLENGQLVKLKGFDVKVDANEILQKQDSYFLRNLTNDIIADARDDIEEAEKEIADRLAEPPAQADDDDARTTQDQLPDCPIALRVPAGFSLDPRGIWCKLPAKKQGGEPILVKVVNTPVIPTKIFCSRDHGGYSYEIAIRRDGQWHYATFDGRTLQDPRRVIDLCNDGASILEPRLLAKFFADILVDSSLPKVRVFSQTGWQKDGTFVDPCGGIDSTGTAYICKRSGLDYDEMFSACGDAEQWKQTLRKVISSNQQRLIRVVIGAALAPPLLKILHVPNFWLHLQGTKNSAKTALLRFALSIFGDPAEGCLLRTFDSTPKNRVAMAAALNDLPQGIDELETLSPKERAEVEKSAYDFVSGVDGQRNKKNGDVREAVRFRGVRLSTGESPLLSSSAKGGAFKRTILIHINQPLFSNHEARDLHIFSLENHGHYRKQWIDYIITNADAIKADFVKVLDRIGAEGIFSEYSHIPAETVDETHIRSVTISTVAFFHFHRCLGLTDTFDTTTATQDAQHILGTLPTKAESDDLNRAIDALASWVSEHPKNFAAYAAKTGVLEGAFGYETSGILFADGRVAIYPNALRRICEDELHLPSFGKFVDDCFDEDLLDAPSRREKAKQMKICGQNKRFYLFKLGVLTDDPAQDDAAEPDYDDAYNYYDK